MNYIANQLNGYAIIMISFFYPHMNPKIWSENIGLQPSRLWRKVKMDDVELIVYYRTHDDDV